MGNWHISIEGVGCHHNPDLEYDADKLAKEFVELLRKYHTVSKATFTYGAKQDL